MFWISKAINLWIHAGFDAEYFFFSLAKQTHKEISEQICVLKSFSVYLFKARHIFWENILT